MSEKLEFSGFIENVKYRAFLTEPLTTYQLSDFDINSCKPYGIIQTQESQIAFSKWVSPKRTRSYPFARIYNTYNQSKVLTVIRVIKDEGKDGDLDRIQYSTFTWMNLLNIYIVLGFYVDAQKNMCPKQKNKNKLTNQKFDNVFLLEQINKVVEYKQSALHWNTNLFNTEFTEIFKKALDSYAQISRIKNVEIHERSHQDKYLKEIVNDFENFKNISLRGSRKASIRESETRHNLEFLDANTKATFCITNYLGGTYYLTADEVFLNNKIYIIQESKNSTKKPLPDIIDIQDGLFKLILYSNLSSLRLHEKEVNFTTRLRLTGVGLIGTLIMPCSENEKVCFLKANSKVFTKREVDIVKALYQETILNKKLNIFIGSN